MATTLSLDGVASTTSMKNRSRIKNLRGECLRTRVELESIVSRGLGKRGSFFFLLHFSYLRRLS